MSATRTLPSALAEQLRDSHRANASAWWNSLDDASKSAIAVLCDERLDEIATVLDGDGWCELSIELHGRFVDPENAREDEMWSEDLIEYINNRPEMRFHLEERTFHICRAHPAARDVVRTGLVPCAFACPAKSDGCPFEAASAAGNGRALRLVASLRVVAPRSKQSRAQD